jgi:hypothetical protein
LLGARLLHVPEHGVGDHDRRDHDRVDRQSLSAFQNPHDEGSRSRCEQQVDEWVGEVAEKLAPHGDRLGGVEPVRPELPQPGGGLPFAQPAVDVGSERARNIPGLPT